MYLCPLPHLSLKEELLKKLAVVMDSLSKRIPTFQISPEHAQTHVDASVRTPGIPLLSEFGIQDIRRGIQQHEPKFPVPEASTQGWQQIRHRGLNVMALKGCLHCTGSLKPSKQTRKSWINAGTCPRPKSADGSQPTEGRIRCWILCQRALLKA